MLLTAPKSVQPLPASYCHVPLESSTPITAIPSTGNTSASVIRSPVALAMIDWTVSPDGLASSSLISDNVIVPELSSTGASLMSPVITTAAAAVLARFPAPSTRFDPSITWTV